MNHKATATCSNGHTFQWGTCKAQKNRLFGGTKICGSHAFEQIYEDGSRLTVSFDDRPFTKIQCVGCKTVFTTTTCPQCGVDVPVSAIQKKGFAAHLG
jgi:hypothetical protein